MGQLADLTAAAEPITINGDEYYISPLDFNDFGELESWMEGLPLEVAKQHLDGMATDDRRVLLERAFQACEPGSVEFGTEKAERIITTARGLRQIVWQSLKKRKPTLTRHDVGRMITIDNLPILGRRIMAMSGLSGSEAIGDESNGDGDADPTAPAGGESSSVT